MELSNKGKLLLRMYSNTLWFFVDNIKQGDVNCINGAKERSVIAAFYKLIKTYSKENISIGYLVGKKQNGSQNLYLRYDNISQSKPLSSFYEIDQEIKRMVMHYEKPVIFIKDFFKISIESNYWQESKNIEFEVAIEKLKSMGRRYKVPIFITMFFDSEEVLKQYYLCESRVETE